MIRKRITQFWHKISKESPFIIGVMSVYNAGDIIEQTITHLHENDIPIVVIENGSADESYEILKQFEDDSIIDLSRMKTEFFDWGLMLKSLYEKAVKWNPRWMLFIDQDEFPESPLPSLKLKQAIQQEDQKGYNLIQFNNFEFWPTEKDDKTEKNVRKRIRYYTWSDNWRFKCFKNYSGTNFIETGGHLPIFPRKIRVNLSPNKFTIRHYPILSYIQGVRRTKERLERFSEQSKKKWGLKWYSKFGQEQHYYVINSSQLSLYNEDGRWNFNRKFDGHRGYSFPNLNTSLEIEKEMAKYRD